MLVDDHRELLYHATKGAGDKNCSTLNGKERIMKIEDVLSALKINQHNPGVFTGSVGNPPTDKGDLVSQSPIDDITLGSVCKASEDDYEHVVTCARKAFADWRLTPAPKRGEVVRQIGHKLRQYKEPLGYLVTLETGKPLQEGLGEVQEAIDIADFAVGLSRQLYGFTMHSERREHRMYDQYHPLGPVGIITSFNFPVAQWSWNALIATIYCYGSFTPLSCNVFSISACDQAGSFCSHPFK